MPQVEQTNRAVDTPTAELDRTPEKQPGKDLVEYLKDYARDNPEVAALWCLGVGFVLGWKLKPW